VSASTSPNLLASATGRRWLFALLYLSEGAPIGFVWWALPTLLRARGVSLEAITTLTTLATVPWILKFFVAPAIDFGLRRRIPLRRWIVACQLAMSATLLPLAFIDWSTQFEILLGIVVFHALFAAVQDVSIDTLAIYTVPPAELGRVNGWMQAGMLTGRAGVAAGSTLLATRFEHPAAAVVVLAVLIALPLLVLVVAVKEPAIDAVRSRSGGLAKRVFSRNGIAGLGIALLVGGGFEFFGVSAGPRLTDAGASSQALAIFYGLLAPGGLAVGALAGGALTDRIGALRATGCSLAFVTAVLVSIAVADLTGLDGARLAWFAVAYLAIGGLTSSSYALLMSLSRGEFAATRFSLFMAMTNACEAWSGFVGGRFASYSYGLTLLTLALVACIAALPLFVLSRRPANEGPHEQRRIAA